MSWNSDNAQYTNSTPRTASPNASANVAIGWHRIVGAAILTSPILRPRVAVRTLPHGAPLQLIATQP